MTRKICDACRKEVEPDSYGLAPTGWLTVNIRGDYSANRDYCSPACAVSHIPTLLIPAEKKAA